MLYKEGKMVKNIVLYGDPVLKREAVPVKNIDENIQKLIKDLKDTIKVEGGIGLASNQIGVLKRVIVLNEVISEGDKKESIIFPLINPEIIRKSGEQRGDEGCLSFPGLYLPITRAEKVIVTYMDENGKSVEREFTDLLARAIQHELDHLNGILFIERIDEDDEESKDIVRQWRREFMLSKIVKDRVG